MMDPIAFELGPISVHWYGILIATAFLIGAFGSIREVNRQGINEDHFLSMFIACIICAIVGARLYYVVFQWDYYSQYPSEIIATWHGGLAVHGGIFGGLLALIFCCRYYKMRPWQLMDIMAPFLILGQSIGRWGNFFNQEAYGYAVSPEEVPWAMYIDGAYRHPTFLYESLWDFCGFVLLMLASRSRRLKEGDIALLYFIYYSIGRFIIESFRTDSLMLGPLKTAQMVSLGLITLSIIIAFLRRKKAPLRAGYLDHTQSREAE